jgi:hypothetical protein
LLGQLNMRTPLAAVQAAKKRAARAKTALAFYMSRPSAESLRTLVK